MRAPRPRSRAGRGCESRPTLDRAGRRRSRRARAWPEDLDPPSDADRPTPPDLADVRGQPVARLALEVAAAGGHHLLFVGPPGAGKTMLAQRLPGLLPALDRRDALEATMIHSAAGRGAAAAAGS